MATDNVTVTCSQCGKQYPIPRDRLGRKGKCSCGNVFVVEEVVFDLAAEVAPTKVTPAAPRVSQQAQQPLVSWRRIGLLFGGAGVVLVVAILLESIGGGSVTPVFDVPSLVGKNASEVRAVLGAPSESYVYRPTAVQKQLGITESEGSDTYKSATSEGALLLVTYDPDTLAVTDFFIGTDDPSGKTSNTRRLLALGNLKQDDPAYRVEFVGVGGYYTGAKVVPAQ